MWKNRTEARLMFAVPGDVLDRYDQSSLCDRLRALGLGPEAILAEPGMPLVLLLPEIRLTLAEAPAPLPLCRFRGITRPRESKAQRRAVLQRLAAHRARLTVAAEDRSAIRPACNGLKRRLVWEVVRHLLTQCRPDLVQCPGRDRLMTGVEAAGWLDHIDARVPRFSAAADPARSRRKEVFLSEPELSPRAADWIGGRSGDGRVEETPDFTDVLRGFLAHRADARSLPETAAGRSALYVMSATIMLFMLPLGASALTYNALSGGSLRVTAHMMAVTGLCTMGDRLGLADAVRALGGL